MHNRMHGDNGLILGRRVVLVCVDAWSVCVKIFMVEVNSDKSVVLELTGIGIEF